MTISPHRSIYFPDHLGGLDTLDRSACYSLLSALADGSRFREFKPRFGRGLVTGFSFVRGRLVGLLVNCGPLDADDAQKGAHFVQLCDNRAVPMVFLQNGSNSINK